MQMVEAKVYTQIGMYVTVAVVIWNVLLGSLYRTTQFIPKSRGTTYLAVGASQVLLTIEGQGVALLLYGLQYANQYLYCKVIPSTWSLQGIHVEYIIKGFLNYIVTIAVLIALCAFVKEILDKFGWISTIGMILACICLNYMALLYQDRSSMYVNWDIFWNTVFSYWKAMGGIVLAGIVIVLSLVLVIRGKRRECYRSSLLEKLQWMVKLGVMFTCLYVGLLITVLSYYQEFEFTLQGTTLEYQVVDLFEGEELQSPFYLDVYDVKGRGGRNQSRAGIAGYDPDEVASMGLPAEAVSLAKEGRVFLVYQCPIINWKEVITTPKLKVETGSSLDTRTITIDVDAVQFVSVAPYSNLNYFFKREEQYLRVDTDAIYSIKSAEITIYVPEGELKVR